jgi:hypothetical protein
MPIPRVENWKLGGSDVLLLQHETVRSCCVASHSSPSFP